MQLELPFLHVIKRGNRKYVSPETLRKSLLLLLRTNVSANQLPNVYKVVFKSFQICLFILFSDFNCSNRFNWFFRRKILSESSILFWIPKSTFCYLLCIRSGKPDVVFWWDIFDSEKEFLIELHLRCNTNIGRVTRYFTWIYSE